MGNSSSSRAPRAPATNIYPRTSLNTFNPNFPNYPVEPFPAPGPYDTLNALVAVPVVPIDSSNSTVLPISAPGPPAISPVTAIVLRTPEIGHPLDSITAIVPIESPNPLIPAVPTSARAHENFTVPATPFTANSQKIRRTPDIPKSSQSPELQTPSDRIPFQNRESSNIPRTSQFPEIPFSLQTPETHKVRRTPDLHQDRHTPDILPISSPPQTPELENNHPKPAIRTPPQTPIIPTNSEVNAYLGFSPDSTAVTPTADLRTSPIRSPTPTRPVSHPTKALPSPLITHDISTSPRLALKTNASPKSTSAQSKTVTEKRAPLTPTNEPKKSTVRKASYTDQWDDETNIDEKFAELAKKSTYIKQRTPSITRSVTSSLSKHTDVERKASPAVQSIIAVPSFSLRTTAVYHAPEEEQVPSARTQSIHGDISIFQYHTTARETQPLTGNHTKATMFQMNTQQKQTPLPTPSLLFLTKNFTDGNHQTNDTLTMGPTFGSLGLQNDRENEAMEEYPSNTRWNEIKQQKRTLPRSSILENDRPENTDFIQFVSSTDQLPDPKQRSNRLLGASPNRPQDHSLHLPKSKASQSISRSERIIHGQRIEIF